MDKRKLFFIVVILLLAVVYTAGTVWGATKSGDSKSDSGFTLDPTQLAKQLGGIQDSLAKPPALSTQEMQVNAAGSTSSDCLKVQGDLIVPVGATCLFTIAPVERSPVGISPTTRRMELTLVEGAGVGLTLEEKVKQDNGNEMKVTIERTLLPAAPAKPVDVYADGGKLTLTCQKGTSAANCRLRLAK
jgi:hypothetical protein